MPSEPSKWQDAWKFARESIGVIATIGFGLAVVMRLWSLDLTPSPVDYGSLPVETAVAIAEAERAQANDELLGNLMMWSLGTVAGSFSLLVALNLYHSRMAHQREVENLKADLNALQLAALATAQKETHDRVQSLIDESRERVQIEVHEVIDQLELDAANAIKDANDRLAHLEQLTRQATADATFLKRFENLQAMDWSPNASRIPMLLLMLFISARETLDEDNIERALQQVEYGTTLATIPWTEDHWKRFRNVFVDISDRHVHRTETVLGNIRRHHNSGMTEE